ncbi:MAG: CvpA family protein [Pseudomonadota bacterium]
MEGFTLVDGAVALIVVISALLAYSRGFVREVLSIAAWGVAGVLAFVFAPQAEPLIKEIPIVGDFIGESCEIAIIAAFGAVFAVALVVMSIITPLFSSIVQRSALNGIDQGLGFLFGVLRGLLLVAVAFFVYEVVLASQSLEMIDNSRSAAVFGQITQSIQDQNPEEALGWLRTQYLQLVGDCGA